MEKLFISGVPGTGKTTVAERIAAEHGYVHIDMEANDFEGRREVSRDPEAFMGRLTAYNKIIVSWGFGPFSDREAIDRFIKDGYRFFWLDGDRIASFQTFMEREGNDLVMEYTYYGQMQMIVGTRIIEQLQPTINPFDENGAFRSLDAITNDILSTETR